MAERKKKVVCGGTAAAAFNKINKAVSMKIVMNDSKRYKIPVKRDGLKTLSQKRGVDETKNF